MQNETNQGHEKIKGPLFLKGKRNDNNQGQALNSRPRRRS